MAELGVSVRCCQTCRAIYRTDFVRCPTDGTPLGIVDADPLLGATVANYVVDALIGEGAMGRVYRAHHTLLHHKQVALKVLIGDLASTLATRLRFGQEADSASRLAHPNVVSVIDFGKTDEGLMFLAMELVEGRTLAEIIAAEGALAPERVIELARQVCLGLQHAHDRGLVHRDFKPENVLIARGADGASEHALIADFGIAISRDDDAPARLTTAGIALGTPMYASPEQTHGRPVDQRADLFALGVTMYEMLAGKVPFDGTALEMIHYNAEAVPPAIEARSGLRVPPALEAVAQRLMARSPDGRYGSAGEVLEVLADTEAMLAPRPEAPAPVTPPLPPPRAPWGVVALAVATVAAIAAVVIVAVSRHDAHATATIATGPRQPAIAPGAIGPTEKISSVTVTPILPSESPPVAATPPQEPPALEPPALAPARTYATAHQAAPLKRVTTRSAQAAQAARAPEAAPPAPVAVEPPAEDGAQRPAAEPPPAPPAVPAQQRPVAAAPAPLLTRASASFGKLAVHGSLPDGEIRRALERGMPGLRACFARTVAATHRSLAASVRVAFVVDDTRGTTAVQASAAEWPELAACVGGVVGELRTQVAPDVGTVAVTVEVAFQPEAP